MEKKQRYDQINIRHVNHSVSLCSVPETGVILKQKTTHFKFAAR